MKRKNYAYARIRSSATCVRLPVVSGHSESVYIEVEKEGVTVEEFKSLLANAEGIVLQDNPEEQLYPMPATAVGKTKYSLEESVKI